ncbi:hypothetical protein OTB20_24070 [Streptomyces sp. H27-H1]|uniref:hypothetical protein n=1 Tax=Streptomyces sp. H27-H1 TaxID=2996461 RepID=UPI00226F26C8|nr:hypothetical protein [Streptomyces sp. H27-H1]MCY0929219.1 hypothetical protein [Streptomyces sp. H27-H1]
MADAEKVFNTYGWANSIAEGRADFAAISKLQTGALLEQSRARHERKNAHAIVRDGDIDFTRSVFVIPTVREQPGYPRSFVVFSKDDGQVEDRATAVHYFVQAAAGGPWKAAATSWVNGDPVVQGAVTPREHPYEQHNVEVREKEIAAPVTGVAGAGVLSARAGTDRKACGRYADYMSFTAPQGEPKSEHFVPGGLTSGVVDRYNERDKQVEGKVRHEFGYKAAGGELPVVRLASGASLVTCTYVVTERLAAKQGTAWFFFTSDTDSDRLLGGGSKHWRAVERRWAVTAVIEVPEQGPADVVAVNSRGAELLSARRIPE